MTRKEKMVNLAECFLHNMNDMRYCMRSMKTFPETRNLVEDLGEDLAWCQAFIIVLMEITDSMYMVSNYHAIDCTGFVSLLTKNNRFDLSKKRGGGQYKPERGDLVFFHNGKKISHVAIIYGIDTSKNLFRIIEGNYDNKMNTRLISFNDETIYGYGNMSD